VYEKKKGVTSRNSLRREKSRLEKVRGLKDVPFGYLKKVVRRAQTPSGVWEGVNLLGERTDAGKPNIVVRERKGRKQRSVAKKKKAKKEGGRL